MLVGNIAGEHRQGFQVASGIKYCVLATNGVEIVDVTSNALAIIELEHDVVHTICIPELGVRFAAEA